MRVNYPRENFNEWFFKDDSIEIFRRVMSLFFIYLEWRCRMYGKWKTSGLKGWKERMHSRNTQ